MILNILRDIYHDSLMSHRRLPTRAKEYLYSRGLNTQTLNHFKVGFCHDYNAYHKLMRLGISDEIMLESRMFIIYNDRIKEHLNNMIVIPIIYDGTTVHFTGRYVDKDWITLKQTTPHKHRPGKFWWAFNEDYTTDSKYVVLVESPIDTMTLWQNKINSMATFGINGLSEHVAARVKEKYKRIYIAYDKDINKAGDRGAKRLASLFFRMGAIPKILTWPENIDNVDINSFFLNNERSDFLDLLSMADEYIHIERPEKTYVSVPMEIDRIAKHYFKLKYVNRGYMVPCPYHKDGNPSMHIFTDTNEFYCYGCGVAGKPLQLLMFMEESLGHKITTKEAIQLYRTF